MTLDEAIKHGERKVKQNVFQADPEALTALKLLIEAGKAWELPRETMPHPALWLLPGETEEEVKEVMIMTLEQAWATWEAANEQAWATWEAAKKQAWEAYKAASKQAWEAYQAASKQEES